MLRSVIVSVLFVTACGSKSGPSQADCQAALDHLAQIAEAGQNQIPAAQYKKENQAGILGTCPSWSQAKLECVRAMTDIQAKQWAECESK